MKMYKVEADKPMEHPEPGKEKPKQPCVYIPLDKDYLKTVKAGESIEILLKGKIESVTISDGKSYPRNEIGLALDEVGYPGKTEIEEMMAEDE